MALLSNNPITSLLSLKNLVLSISVLSISTILKLCCPFLFQFAVARVPMLWPTFGSWLTPPYLYVVINFIILAIALSSRFQHKIEGTVNVGASVTTIPTNSNNESGVFVKKESSATCKTNFEVIRPRTEVKPPADLEMHRDTKPMKAAMEVKSKFEKVEMRSMRQAVEDKSNFEAKTMRKTVEVKCKVEEKVEARMTNKCVHFESSTNNKFAVKEKMETRVDDRTRTTKIPNVVKSTVFANGYSLSNVKELGFEHAQQTILQAENDTLEDTWNMIMEKRRLQNAGSGEASHRM